MTMSDEMVQICKQAVVVYFKVTQCLLSENTEKQTRKLPDTRPIIQSRFLTCENFPSVTIRFVTE